MMSSRVLPGSPYPLGARWDGNGINFTLYSENAERVELLLFDDCAAPMPARAIELPEQTAHVWHGYVPGLTPGQVYAYRVHGPYAPEEGHRFNPHKVLLDPYSTAIAGSIDWDDSLFGYRVGAEEEDLSLDERDSAPHIPKCVVIDPSFDWQGDRLPRRPWNETIIYEVHVKGFTATHPDIEPALRGTFAGLASPPAIAYLTDLGVTAVELLPVHHHVTERALVDKGLSNYWGYNSIGFFAPDSRYSSSGVRGQQVNEFKQMVRSLHQAGIEVILDVVYNHTAEGNHLGPTLSLRGIDNTAYYRLMPDELRYYMDFTGCGNSLNMNHPQALQLIMDSLRYWVNEMHVDGFRFDLAAALAREMYEVDRLSSFFDIIQQDPVLSQVKLIAEPWDLGPGGYQVGNFPPLWTEWNGEYRNTVRRFWKGDETQMAEFAYRLTGSSDLYQSDGRHPFASINFVTCHDGFTLNDLVSYDHKHNEANKDDNQDGAEDNLSWNCGTEGPTDDAGVMRLREKQKRNFLATLFLSQGVPMLLSGDEVSRTQQGNNNVYCQDNELSWFDWDLRGQSQSLYQFTRMLIHLRREHPIFRLRKYFQGDQLLGVEVQDLAWFQPSGEPMQEEDWQQPYARTLGAILCGEAIDEVDEDGNPVKDDTFCLLFNAHHESVSFTLPGDDGQRWQLLLDTSNGETGEEGSSWESGKDFPLQDRCLAVFQAV